MDSENEKLRALLKRLCVPAANEAEPASAQDEQLPGLRHTDQWESARVADYNAGWNDRHTAEFSRLTDDQIFDIAEPFGEFRYGDAQGDRRLAFARAIIAATAAPIAQDEQWISVAERLPECGERVLCWIDIGDMKYAEVVTWHGSFFGDMVALKVTHWLPLPAAPSP